MGVQPPRLPQLGKCNIDFWRHGHSPGLTVLGMPQGKLLPSHVYVGPFQPEEFTTPWAKSVQNRQEIPEMGSSRLFETEPFIRCGDAIPFILRVRFGHICRNIVGH